MHIPHSDQEKNMEDIIETMPWTCDGADGCTHIWHQRAYWCYDDGTYSVDEYSDGDHETVEPSDLPSPEEVSAAWMEYYRYVAATGEDPIGDFLVKREVTRNERWQFRFKRSILEVLVVRGKHAGKFFAPQDFPDHVLQYLNLESPRIPKLRDFETIEEFESPGLRLNVWVTQRIQRHIPRSEKLIATELKKMARKAILDLTRRQ